MVDCLLYNVTTTGAGPLPVAYMWWTLHLAIVASNSLSYVAVALALYHRPIWRAALGCAAVVAACALFKLGVVLGRATAIDGASVAECACYGYLLAMPQYSMPSVHAAVAAYGSAYFLMTSPPPAALLPLPAAAEESQPSVYQRVARAVTLVMYAQLVCASRVALRVNGWMGVLVGALIGVLFAMVAHRIAVPVPAVPIKTD
jgi:membrane-associated phospholipid phosphatase